MKTIKTSIPRIGLLTVKLFGLMEIFIFFGIQFFWILYKGDLLPTENSWDLLTVFFPFLIAYIVGIFCRIEKYRSLFRKMEWLIHLLISICFLIFIIVLQTRDEFNPDYTVWMDTIKEGRFEDTNRLFEKPKNVDYHVSQWFDDTHAQLVLIVQNYMLRKEGKPTKILSFAGKK